MAHQVKDATIRVRTLDNGWETIGVDRARGISHENLEYDHDRWGSLTASFDLRRAPRTPWPDIAESTDVEIEIAGVQTWKGRVNGTPTRDGADRSMNVQCEGLQAHLDDDTYVPFYVHTRLADWKDIRSDPNCVLTSFTAPGAVVNDNGAVTLSWPQNAQCNPNTVVGVTLDLGPAAAAKRVTLTYDSRNVAGGTFRLYVTGHDLAGVPTIGSGGDNAIMVSWDDGAAAANTFTGSFTNTHRYVTVYLLATGSRAAGAAASDFLARILALNVYADTAYESGNASALKASTVIPDALTKATVLLDADRSLIATTSFSIPDLAQLDDKTPREVWDAVNAFHNYASKIDERGRPVFQPLPSAPRIEVGEWTALDGSDANQSNLAEIYNRGILTGRTPAGAPARFERYQADKLTKHTVQLNNPSADTDVANWSTTNPNPVTRDTGTFDTTPASFRLLSMPFKTTATGTVAAGTFEKHRTYVLEFRWRPDGNHAMGAPDPDTWADGGSCQFQFGTSTDFGKLTLVGWNSAGTWTTLRVLWSPAATVTSGVEFRYLQGRYGTNSLRLDSFTVYRSDATRVDRRGFRRTKRLPIDAPIPTDGTAANQILDTFLATHKTAQFKGEYVITGPVREILTGKTVPPEQLGMRTTELLRFTDRIDPDTGAVGRDGRIVRVKYSHAEDQASVSIDNSSQNFEALLARYGALVGGPR